MRILIIDDDADTCMLLSRFFIKNGYQADSAFSGTSAIGMLQKNTYSVVLCDFRLGDYDGSKMIEKIKDINNRTQVIIITGYSDIRIAVEVMKAGAYNYITKPLLPDEVLLNVKEAVEKFNDTGNARTVNTQKNQAQTEKVKRKYSSPDYFEGVSKEAEALYHQIDLVATTNYSIIINGESGTGKEAAAKRIHDMSPRRNEIFVAVDCGVLSKELAASELLGHEKGSFTGAISDKTGSFEYANKGTLFLDEVINLSYEIQAMLLRVLQEKKIRKIGGNRDIDIDVRIIVASNENLWEAVKKGKFREDLYHRFNEFSITIPPLRERNVDIMLFADFFLKKACAELNRTIKGFSPEVEQVFMNYAWPGNLREMNNVIKRATLLTQTEIIEPGAIPQELIYSEKFNFPTDHESIAPKSEEINLKTAAIDAEYQLIYETLKKVNYNKTKAAKLLNVDRKTLYNKMKQYNLIHDMKEMPADD